MMELLKKHIHMNRRRGNVTSQMTLDDDFNVPDSMDDVEELIMENGEVKIDSVKNPGEKAEVSGKLEFRILYRRPGGELTALAGSIPFTETVHMPGLSENDYVQAGWELDDLNVSLINSRKLNVKALVTLNLRADEILDMETLGCHLMAYLGTNYPEALRTGYKLPSLPERQDGEEDVAWGYRLLEAVGKKRGFLISGGEVDTERMAKILLDEYRAGKLGRFTLEMPGLS